MIQNYSIGSQFKTGNRVPIEGVYRSTGIFSGNRTNFQVYDIHLDKGQTFPPVRGCRGGVVWTLIQQ